MNWSNESQSYRHTAFIGMGSNAGNRWDNLGEALRLLRNVDGIGKVTCSPVYETRPMGCAGPTEFLNAVMQIDTNLMPRALLAIIAEIEVVLGRTSERAGPRTIDLDILLYDDLEITTEDLTIPHPRMHIRAFVLMPFGDLAPEVTHPASGKAIWELLTRLPDKNEIIGCMGYLVQPDVRTSSPVTQSI